MGGRDRWAKIHEEQAKLAAVAEEAKDKVAGAVAEVKKTVS